MSSNEQHILIALIAVAIGLALGRLWGGLTRRGRPANVKGLGELVLGLDLMASRQIDRAIAELTRAARADTEAIEVYLILGNLFREKGQLERAIQIHQSVLHRPGLASRDRAHALLCLAVDFKRAGFRDRAADTLDEVLRLAPDHSYALLQLLRIQEEEQNWARALAIQQRLDSATGETHPKLTAFLHDRVGQAALAAGDDKAAGRNFEAAIGCDASLAPAYLHLGDLQENAGDLGDAVRTWETLVTENPDHAYLAFERLERAYSRMGAEAKIERLYQSLMARDGLDWRAHLALARIRARDGQTDEALELLIEAAGNNPHAVGVHLEAWTLLSRDGVADDWARKYIDRIRGSVFFLDPHICVKCHYRANGILWRCPHCQEWSTFVEERLSARRSPKADEA